MKRPSFVWMSPAITMVGKRFGIDAHYFAKSSVFVGLSYTVSALKGLITGYLVTRLFPPAMYGEYRFVLGIIGTVGVISLPGISNTLATAIARKESVSLDRIAKWCSLVSGIGSIVLLGCIALLPSWGKMELWPLFVVAALLSTPSAVATNLFGGVIRGAGAFEKAFYVSLINNSLLTLSVLLMLVTHPSSLLLLALTIGIPAVVYIASLIPWEKTLRSSASQKPILYRALNLSFASVPTSLSWYIDGLLVSALFGLNQLALLSVALLIPEQVKVGMKELLPILLSKQSQGEDTRERRRKMDRAVIGATALLAGGILLYILAAPFIIPILFPLYPAADLVWMTQIAALMLVSAPAAVYCQFLEARRNMRMVHVSNWSASIVFVIALFTLIPTFGPLGAIYARGLFRLTLVSVARIGMYFTPIAGTGSVKAG